MPRIARTIINHASLTPSNHDSAITNKINQQHNGFGLSRITDENDDMISSIT